MITQQQFDTITKGLAAQNWEKSESNGTCDYRGPNGLKCAIGQLIDDDLAEMADNEAFSYRQFATRGHFLDLTPHEFNALQRSHDNSDDPDDMKQNFLDLATYFNLEFNT